MSLHLGKLHDGDQPEFHLSHELLETHLAIFGGTRYGKSKLLELLCRELIFNRHGLAFIDPHSDTADDLFRFLCVHSEESEFIKRKIHYLNPNEHLFSFNPFRYQPDPENPLENTEAAYRKWLHVKIEDMIKIICRVKGITEAELQQMARLNRWLYSVLYAVGVRQDKQGTCLSLKDALILLNPQHPLHDERYSRVVAHLSDQVRADFETLHRTKEPRKQEDWTESSINALRSVISENLEDIFDPARPSIDFGKIVSDGDILLASLGKTRFFHEDEAMAVAGLMIREISEAVRLSKRQQRRTFHLFIDEAHNFLGDDLIRLLKESAKYKLVFGLAVQGLDNLQKGEIDMVPAVLGQCGIRITFRQQFHEHAEALAKSLCYPMLDFTELMQEVDRFDGYDMILTPSISLGESEAHGINWSITDSVQRGIGIGRGKSVTESFGESATKASTIGKSHSAGRSHTDGESSGEQQNLGFNKSQTIGTSQGSSFEVSEGTSESVTNSSGSSRNKAHSNSESHGKSVTENRSSAESRSEHRNSSDGRNLSTRHDGTHHGETAGVSDGEGRVVNEGLMRGTSEQESWTESDTEGESSHDSQALQSGKTQNVSHGINRSDSRSESSGVQAGFGLNSSFSSTDGRSETDSISEQLSDSIGTNHSMAFSDQVSLSESLAFGTAETHGESFTGTKSRSVSLQVTPLQRIRVEKQRTGRLVVSTQDQFAKFTAAMSSLQKRQCLVSVAAFNTSFLMDVRAVDDPFEKSLKSPLWQGKALQAFSADLISRRDYYVSRPIEESSTTPTKPDETGGELPFGI